jgi:hypothetical protein
LYGPPPTTGALSNQYHYVMAPPPPPAHDIIVKDNTYAYDSSPYYMKQQQQPLLPPQPRWSKGKESKSIRLWQNLITFFFSSFIRAHFWNSWTQNTPSASRIQLLDDLDG